MNHSHILYDSDPHFRIDTISRNIINESSQKTKLMQHDHNSERFTFEMPRFIEGHDMASCNLVEIHYLNIESNTKIVHAGVYTVNDLHIKDDDEDKVVCSWLIPSNATQVVGQLQFLLRFACVNDDTGKIEYVWNTSPYTNITISSGIYNTDTASDNPVPAYSYVTTVNGDTLKFFVGTKAEYFALTNELRNGLFAILTDDTTKVDMEKQIEDATKMVEDATNTVEETASSIATLRDDLVSGEFVVKTTSCDEQSNVIHETYGNFARDWEGGLESTTFQLSEHGVYLFQIGLVITEYNIEVNRHTPRDIDVSTLVCFNGNETYAPLIDKIIDDDGAHEIFRLKITNNGLVSVQSHYSSDGSGFTDYDNIDNVSIYCKRIL